MHDFTIGKIHLGVFCLFTLVLSACGPAAPTLTPFPTLTSFPTFVFVPPTEAPQVVTVGMETATAGAAAIDPDLIAAGKGRYEALQCGSCHGDDAKGTDKGPALVGTKLTQAEFVNVLRTGGKLGNDHLYSTNRLSDAGGKNIYLYVLSLSK
jgi:mono/diheme cytochrome c family protein